MKIHTWGIAATLAATALMAVPGGGEAAPAPPSRAGVASAEPAVVTAAYRTCWRRDGVRHCRWVDDTPRRTERDRHNGSGPLDPDAYRAGSARWWQEMDRSGRGGQSDTP